MRAFTRPGHIAASAALAAALLPLAMPAASAQAFASPSGQVYQTRIENLTSLKLAIAFGSGESGGTVTITQLDTGWAPPPPGLEVGTLGEWSQAADGSVTISGDALYFLPDGGPATCQIWAADYSGQEETCWFNNNGVSDSELHLQ